MFIRFTSIIATISLIASVNGYGMIAQVVDATDFCVFLPPDDATDRIISNSEWNANAYCMGSTPLAKGAGTLPDGFIKSAHYVKTDAYVQVTGQMDYTKANLDGTDGGGQMDVKAPVGSSCAGWLYYVNLIEPDLNTYCMRCCNDSVNCNRGISEKGCAHIIPGDYSGPNDGAAVTTSVATASSDLVVSTTSVAVTTTTSATTISEATTSIIASSSISPSAVSSYVVPLSSALSSTSSSIVEPSGNASAQSVSDAATSKPMIMTVGTGLLISALILA